MLFAYERKRTKMTSGTQLFAVRHLTNCPVIKGALQYVDLHL